MPEGDVPISSTFREIRSAEVSKGGKIFQNLGKIKLNGRSMSLTREHSCVTFRRELKRLVRKRKLTDGCKHGRHN